MYHEIKLEGNLVLTDEEYLKFKQALESAKRQGLDLTEEKFASHLLTYGANSRLRANMDNIINIEKKRNEVENIINNSCNYEESEDLEI